MAACSQKLQSKVADTRSSVFLRQSLVCLLLLSAVEASLAQPAATVSMLEAKDMPWTDTTVPAGGKQAGVWSDSRGADRGVMLRWRFNSKLRDQVRSEDAYYVVLAGTFTVEIGNAYREFGPGGFVSIPRGLKHTIGCEAAGECRLFLHLHGGFDSTPSKP